MNNDKKSRRNVAPLVAGVVGGGTSTLLLYPLDLVKVRLQVNDGPIRAPQTTTTAAAAASAANGISSVPVTTNTNQLQRSNHSMTAINTKTNRQTIMCTVRGVVRHEGILGLYQGLGPALLGSAMSWGGYFFLYEGIKSRMLSDLKRRRRRRREHANHANASRSLVRTVEPKYEMSRDMHVDEEIIDLHTNDSIKLGPIQNFTAACLAGAVMVLATNPLWLIKTRMQLQMKRYQQQQQETLISNVTGEKIKPPYKNMLDAARTIVREEGPLALYKGAVPAMMLVSHGGVQFVSYEFLKNHFGTYTKAIRDSNDEKNGVFERLQDSLGYLAIGAVSKIIASTTTYPIQVIKSRLQQRSQSLDVSESGEVKVVTREYAGVRDCALRIWRREGIYGFFKGCIPNALRVAPSAAITFVVYESIIDIMSPPG